ncbi:hypothetical protein IAQ61_006634 [Plenodomus lingam]|uniref:uncharacterized protein n=1 Tax=Leptosphaeria maculans TaxID=5022 RepID=UPI0033303175|nr:hypothetical protein IAQ61_006634 [Plenodomus lingam]
MPSVCQGTLVIVLVGGGGHWWLELDAAGKRLFYPGQLQQGKCVRSLQYRYTPGRAAFLSHGTRGFTFGKSSPGVDGVLAVCN